MSTTLKDIGKLIKTEQRIKTGHGRPYRQPDERDMELFAQWWRGEKTAREVAKELKLSVATVRSRFTRIKKLAANTAKKED